MFGKIINFRRSEGAASAVTPNTITSDNPFVEELLAEEGGTIGDRVSPKVSPRQAAAEYLDVALAEIYQLYTLADKAPPKHIKLETLFERYDQLRLRMGWPRLSPDQLSKHLTMNNCISRRVGKAKVRMIELPPYVKK